LENRASLIGIIAIIIGATGLGAGTFSIISSQIVEGTQGPPGQDGVDGIDGTDGLNGVDGINGTDGLNGVDGLNGTDGVDGQDAPGGLIVGILDPDYGETVYGLVNIRALIYGSENYSISVLKNDTEIGTSLPLIWNTSTELDGWWNITIIITDIGSDNKTRDEVLVYVENNPLIEPIPGIAAIWESLTCAPRLFKNPDEISVSDIRVNNSEYFNLQSNLYGIVLIKSGWYRFTIRFLWADLATGETYRLESQKNGALHEVLERYVHNAADQYYMFSTVGYISSDGNDVLWFECSYDGTDSFWIHSGQEYNQLVLEYVGE